MAQLETGVLLEVAKRALVEWDLCVAQIELISVSENSVYRVDTDAGEASAMRIHRPGSHILAAFYSYQPSNPLTRKNPKTYAPHLLHKGLLFPENKKQHPKQPELEKSLTF